MHPCQMREVVQAQDRDGIRSCPRLRYREPLLKASSGLSEPVGPSRRGGSLQGSPMRLLLVEDDKKAARVLTRGLIEEGFVVDVAHSGEVGDELAAVQPLRRHRARLAPAPEGRPGRLPRAARPRHPHAHPHAHRPRLAPRPGVGPRQRSRRLPDQALRVRRASRPDPRAPAAVRADPAARAQGRRPRPRPRHPSRDPRGRSRSASRRRSTRYSKP